MEGMDEMETRIRPWHAALLALALGSLLGAQEPAGDGGEPREAPAAPDQEPGARADVDRFVADLRKAHAPDGDVASPSGFHIAYKLTGNREGKSVAIVADTTFLRWEPEPDTVKPLIHTRIHEGETPIERGRDQGGDWIRKDGKTQALFGNVFAEEKEGIQRDVNLAEQLLRYLDPAAVVERMFQVTRVVEEDVAVGGRGRKAHCRTLRGVLMEFPFYYRGGAPAPAQLQVWIEDESGLLVAFEATPIHNGRPQPGLRERYRVADLEANGGVLVPRTIVLYRPGPDGKPTYDAKVEISSLDFAGERTADDLARPRGK